MSERLEGTERLIAACLAQAVEYATGRGCPDTVSAESQTEAREWCLAESGAEAEQRRLWLAALEVPDHAFRQQVHRLLLWPKAV